MSLALQSTLWIYLSLYTKQNVYTHLAHLVQTISFFFVANLIHTKEIIKAAHINTYIHIYTI